MYPSATLHPVVAGCVEACLRCHETAGRVAEAGNSAYAKIGPHLRHCLDHVTCLFLGLETGIVDYDARDRDAAVENDSLRFREAMEAAIEKLGALTEEDLSRSLRIRQIPATGAAQVVVQTTLERELLFVSSHAIHHLAIIAVVADKHGIVIPESLSVAYSTAAYRATRTSTPS
jgi:hypothetical protein